MKTTEWHFEWQIFNKHKKYSPLSHFLLSSKISRTSSSILTLSWHPCLIFHRENEINQEAILKSSHLHVHLLPYIYTYNLYSDLLDVFSFLAKTKPFHLLKRPYPLSHLSKHLSGKSPLLSPASLIFLSLGSFYSVVKLVLFPSKKIFGPIIPPINYHICLFPFVNLEFPMSSHIPFKLLPTLLQQNRSYQSNWWLLCC